MSGGGKAAPVDSRAGDALYSAANADYQWMTSNFADIENQLAGFSAADVAAQIGPAPDLAAARAKVLEENPQLAQQLASPGRLGLSGGVVNAQLNKKIDALAQTRLLDLQNEYEINKTNAAKASIHTNEQTQFGKAVNDARGLAETNMAGAADAAARMDSRRGLAAGASDLEAMKSRVLAFDRAASKAGAMNTTRRGLRDLSIKRAQGASALGQAYKEMGYQNLQAAGNMASSRNQYNASQTRGGGAGALVGGLMGGIQGFMAGGPAGAAVGAGMGAFQGYYS
jgi:hypothetical protein